MKRDIPATKAARFLDPKSYIAPDGREVLHGPDWKKRKKELWDRAGGRCEYEVGGYRCSKEGQIPAHIEPRYPKRDDRLTNLKLYCLLHDRLTEKQSWRKTRFGEKLGDTE